MYIVVHLYGGLLESVTPYQSLALAQKGLAEAIPEPCDCDKEDESLPHAKGVCDSYQEAYLVDVAIGLPGPEVAQTSGDGTLFKSRVWASDLQEVRLESRHTPSKS